MWTRIVLISLVICFATSHPTTEENETSRVPRQLDFGDCCPCPHSKGNNLGARDQDALADTPSDAAQFVDDCPCRLRDADSHGSPSILFPTAMRPGKPYLRPADMKEDPKNLLQPEVGLASSVLETIRKATSEEYQEALARDAARSAARSDQDVSFLNDGTPAESTGNIVTIILQPKDTDNFDDVMSEASHIKEARCIHPAVEGYRSNNIGKLRMPAPQPTHLMKEIFKFPKVKHTGLLHRNLMDMDGYVGASNIKEHVVMDNNKLRNNRPMLKQKIYNNNLGLKLSDNLSKLRIDSNIEDYKIRGPLIPKKRPEPIDKDLDHAPSNNLEEFTVDTQNVKDTSNLRPTQTKNNLLQRPAILRNFLKLKDVELIPSRISDEKFKFTVPKLQLTPLINRRNFNSDGRASRRKPTDLDDLLRDGLKFNLNKRKPIDFGDHDENFKSFKTNTNIQIIPRPRDDIVDTIPSPSNIEENLRSNEILDKNSGNEVTESTVESNKQMIGNNVIDDTESSPSENHSFSARNYEIKKPYETCDSDINFNNKLVSNFEEIETTDSPVPLADKIQDSNEIITEASASQEKETTEEECNKPDINSNESLQKLNGDLDSAAEANNVAEHVLINEEKEPEIPSSFMVPETADVNGLCEEDLNKNNFPNPEDPIKPSAMKINPIPPKGALTSLKENVQKTMDNLKKTNSIMKPELAEDVKSYSLEEHNNEATKGHPSAYDNDVIDPDCDTIESEMEESASTLVLNKETLGDSKENSDSVTTHDLQKLSDSILEASTKTEDTFKSKACDDISEEVENTIEESNEGNQNLDSDTSATSQHEVLITDIDNKNTEANACLNDFGSLKNTINEEEILQSSSTLSNTQRIPDKMTAEASSILDAVIPDPLGLLKVNNNLRSSLLPDIIVQPSPILNDEFNIFRQPPVDFGDIFNLKTSLPTLDDIKLQLSNIFNANEGDVSDELSYEVGYDRDKTNPEMATAASTSKFQAKSPSLKRLEDVNLDIFQMKPLTMTHSDLIPKIPRLNLNSYRAKLAIPKNFNLKPIKLQSALGDKAGVLGATLTIVPDALKLKPLFKSNVDTSPMLPDLLGHSVGSIPSLDELHETMRSNVQSLMNAPLETYNGNNILQNRLRSNLPSDIPESIRSHAENTIKDMKRTIKVLKTRPPSDLNNFADTIKTPHDLVELASRTREDVSDKLKALHYDLNDRLTSMRESIIDEPKLPSLNSPVFTGNNRKYNMRPNSNIIRNKSTTPRTSNRSNLPGRREPLNIYAPRKAKLGESNVKNYKMSPAASVPVPKSVEVPKLKSTSTKSVLPHMRSQLNLKPKIKSFEPNRSVSSIARQPTKSPFDFKKLPLNNPGPFHKNTKITISFTTTPSPTLPVHSSKIPFDRTPEFGLMKGPDFLSKPNPSSRNRANSLSNYNADIKSSPSEVWPSSKQKSAAMDTEDTYSFTTIKPPSKPLFDVTKPKRPLLKQLSKDNLPSLLSDTSGFNPKDSDRFSVISRESKGSPEISTWPDVSDTTFLSKVRETLRARLANFKPVSRDRSTSSRSNTEVEMERSASENVQTVLEEPLKENVSYKCRMVCTKE